MACSQIFGTPPEPVFNMKGCCLSEGLLEELLITQASSNEANIQNVSAHYGVFRCGQLAECIFTICERFKQPHETRFIAVELFDRFMRAYILQLREKSSESLCAVKGRIQKKHSSSRSDEWRTSIRRLCKQTLVFMVSCVQIASKLCSHYKIISCRRCAEMLQEKGHRYSTSKVLSSEMVVLKTLDYNLHTPSPLSYVETLLEIMGHNDPESQVKILHETCLKILDVVYINRKQMYGRLLQLAVGDSPVSERTRSKFAMVENDLMLLATAIIGAASHFVDMSATATVVEHLARITKIPNDDITDFSSIIVAIILG
ncbi:cyclin N-terminal domain-containing protein 1-like [Diadema antillarum]|uniref:cyclin N-terminal domain-containing protein 1-like n=1 Tax=Diadema antillarum TaxID=105358 RepID=UPI003A84D7B3